jgi:hypothetical protein
VNLSKAVHEVVLELVSVATGKVKIALSFALY